MKYLLLIYENEAAWAEKSEAEQGAIFGEYATFTEELRRAGQFLGGEPLQPTATASSVRVRNGRSMVTDGPFAETREQLGGFYLVDVADLDAALALAAKIPTARDGTVEVRPVLPFGES